MEEKTAESTEGRGKRAHAELVVQLLDEATNLYDGVTRDISMSGYDQADIPPGQLPEEIDQPVENDDSYAHAGTDCGREAEEQRVFIDTEAGQSRQELLGAVSHPCLQGTIAGQYPR